MTQYGTLLAGLIFHPLLDAEPDRLTAFGHEYGRSDIKRLIVETGTLAPYSAAIVARQPEILIEFTDGRSLHIDGRNLAKREAGAIKAPADMTGATAAFLELARLLRRNFVPDSELPPDCAD